MPFQGSFGLTAGYIPQPNRVVPTTSTGQDGAVGENKTELTPNVGPLERIQSFLPPRMPLQGSFGLAAGYIPQPNCIVPTTDQGGAIGRKRYGIDILRMPFQGGLELTVGHIPQPDRSIVTGTGQGGTVR